MNEKPTNEYRPMGAWGYFGYNLLFAIPLIGFIFLLVFSFNNSYIARRNYARSFFCNLILVLIFAVITFALVFLFSDTLLNQL